MPGLIWQRNKKAAHNTMMRAKMLQQEPSATVPGMTSTNRVYDPVAPVAPKPGRLQQKVQAWSSEDTPTEELLQIKRDQ
jgi:hypothetical protein